MSPPENSKVHRVYRALRRQGKSKGAAARIAQAQAGEALHSGRKPKKKKR